MLTITPQASEAIRGVLAAEEAPEGSILRISREPEVGLAVSVTGSPQPDDQIVAGEEVDICLEPSAAEMLDDKQLEATVVDGRLTFSVSLQAP
jgi:Fe-S cluster assembly iron-binding protein IscA